MADPGDLTDVLVQCADGQRRAETSLLIRVSDRFREALRQNPGRLDLPVESVASFDIFWRQLERYVDDYRIAWGPATRKVQRNPDYYFPPAIRFPLIRFCVANGAASMIYSVFWTPLTIEEMNYLLWKLHDLTVNVFSSRLTRRLLRRLIKRLLQVELTQARYLTVQTYILLWEALLTEAPDLLGAGPSPQLKYLRLLAASGHPRPALWLPENYSPWPQVRELVQHLGLQGRERELPMAAPPNVPTWEFWDTELFCVDGRCLGERSLLSRVSDLFAEQLERLPYRLTFTEPLAVVQMFLRYLQMYAENYGLWGPSRLRVAKEGSEKYFQPADRLPFFRFCCKYQAGKMLLPLLWQPVSIAEAGEFLLALESEEVEEVLDSFLDSDKSDCMVAALRTRLTKFILLTTTADTARDLGLKVYQNLWENLHGDLEAVLTEKSPRWEGLLLDLLPLAGFRLEQLRLDLEYGYPIQPGDSPHPVIQERIRALLRP